MAAQDINSVVITGNLTQEPELRTLASGTTVCHMRVAVNSRRKNSQTREWEDKPNYLNVVVWGAHGASCAEHLSKGRPVAVEGRLDWREWEAKEGGGKRQAIEIIADTVKFLGGKPSAGTSSSPSGENAAGGGDQAEITATAEEDIPF